MFQNCILQAFSDRKCFFVLLQVVVKKKLHSQNSIMEMAPTLSRRHVRSDGAQNFDFEANCGPDPWENAPPGEFAVAARNLRKVFPAPAGGSPKVLFC